MSAAAVVPAAADRVWTIRAGDWHVAEVEACYVQEGQERRLRELHVFRVSGERIAEQVVHRSGGAEGPAAGRFAGPGSGTGTPSAVALGALGMMELADGNYEEAAAWLAPAVEATTGPEGADSALLSLLPDAVQTLVALGRLDEADRLVAVLETDGRRPGRTWAEAVGARCRGLLLAARGACDDALAALARSLAAHDRLPQLRYDRARTLLVLGLVQRRCNQRRAARTTLEDAVRLFDEVGAARWADNARDELERLGLRPGSSEDLTPTEERVAELASSGMTVREVAAALIVSPKTVEAHLTRVYRKLGIRSRAELGRLMAARNRAGP